jgi:peptidoglycan hydrolase-like protein with peptidoglycan-binding domain
MQVGMSDHEIRLVQAILALLQHSELKVDGIAGPETTEATRKFQMAHRETPTGVVTEDTMDAMLKELRDWNRHRNWVHPDD